MKDGGQAIGVDPVTGQLQSVIQPVDPYGGLRQIPNLRTIESIRDPRYRAKADLLQFNLDVDITPALTFTSQTAYNEDQTYSFQDYNRFKSLPVFRSEEHTSELQSLMRISYAVFCLKKKKQNIKNTNL